MARHHIDQEWDRDALFASRNLVTGNNRIASNLLVG
jgi:hypothetical protein